MVSLLFLKEHRWSNNLQQESVATNNVVFLMLHFFSVVVLLIFSWEVDLSGINNWDANTLYAAGFLDLDELRH